MVEAQAGAVRGGSQSERGVLDRVFGIGPPDHESAKPQSRLIYPLSPFGIAWISVTALFLLYTAVVTPPMIAFCWLDPECAPAPTLIFDVLLDCFFLLDILYNFSTGNIIAGEYEDEWAVVAMRYLRGGFAFDVFTSFPVSFFELAAQAACQQQAAGGEVTSVDSGQLRIIRVLKPLRWFKLARIAKLGKAENVVNFLMDFFLITPRQGKTAKVLAVLIMLIHLVSCTWWLGKVLAATDPADVSGFLEAQPWGSSVEQFAPLETSAGKVQAYIISVYLVTMTLTTVANLNCNLNPKP